MPSHSSLRQHLAKLTNFTSALVCLLSCGAVGIESKSVPKLAMTNTHLGPRIIFELASGAERDPSIIQEDFPSGCWRTEIKGSGLGAWARRRPCIGLPHFQGRRGARRPGAGGRPTRRTTRGRARWGPVAVFGNALCAWGNRPCRLNDLGGRGSAEDCSGRLRLCPRLMYLQIESCLSPHKTYKTIPGLQSRGSAGAPKATQAHTVQWPTAGCIKLLLVLQGHRCGLRQIQRKRDGQLWRS